jgi:probable F420-dependent oxidoreductase
MTAPRPFRFGTGHFISETTSAWTDRIRQIEAYGYDTFLMPDHLGHQFAPLPALLAAAMVTTTLRIGPLVIAADFRHPTLLAKELATFDVLTNGRLEFGIGAGWHKVEYDRAGIPFDAPSVRVERMKEALHIVRGLWRDGPFSFSGTHYTITGMDGWPKPLQRPNPPIMIGAGARGMLAFAAQEADIIGIVAPALREGGLDTSKDREARLAQQVAWVREAAGARFDEIELSMLFWSVRVTDDVRTGAEDIARTRNTPTTAEQVLASPYYLIGSEERIAERLHELRERFGISYITVMPEGADALAPVVARLRGHSTSRPRSPIIPNVVSGTKGNSRCWREVR